jgi:hypothetical protein
MRQNERTPFSGALAFAVGSALSNQVDIRDFGIVLVEVPCSSDLVAGVRLRPEVSHTTNTSDFAPMPTSTGGLHQITPSTGGYYFWQPVDKEGYHFGASFLRLHSYLSSGAEKVSTGAYSIPYMAKS